MDFHCRIGWRDVQTASVQLNMLIPLYTSSANYTNAQEATLATSLLGQPIYSSVIFNSDLNIVRYWDGTAFQNMTAMPPQNITNPSSGSNTNQVATTQWTMSAVPNASYRTILQASGSHIAAKVAGTYAMGVGDPLAVSGTGILYPLQLINIVAADYPTVNGITTKLRVRATVAVNATAPTGNFTIGLYPVTSGGGVATLKIYTLGTLVTGSATTTVTAPAANSMTSVVGADFALPADGVYVLGVVTTAIVAVASLVHINAQLQLRNN